MLIGNLTRDPELRYTPAGTAVCSFAVATNRGWTTEAGERKEETEFHRIVAWNKLAELCSQLLAKGRKVFVEGRLQTRSWQAADGTQKSSTEVVIDDMIILDSRRPEAVVAGGGSNFSRPPVSANQTVQSQGMVHSYANETNTVSNSQSISTSEPKTDASVNPVESNVSGTQNPGEQKVAGVENSSGPKEDINPDDIPF